MGQDNLNSSTLGKEEALDKHGSFTFACTSTAVYKKQSAPFFSTSCFIPSTAYRWQIIYGVFRTNILACEWPMYAGGALTGCTVHESVWGVQKSTQLN